MTPKYIRQLFEVQQTNLQEDLNQIQSYDCTLIDLATLLFLNQQVSTPTRKSNVLDLIFCSDELIKSVDVSECYFSDHCLIKTETYIPVDPITIQAKCINPSLTSFE